ncbi:MAG: transglutaminase TgpA family protein [Desulfosalsimonas sp.]
MNEGRRYVPVLTFALIVATLPHAARLPLWITAWCAVMWGYLLFSLRFGWPGPNRAMRLLLSAAGVAGLMATYRFRLGPEAYVGLLAVMAALKPFESSTHRDRMITVFIAYFIIISKLLESETFAVTLYMFPSVLLTTAALVQINHPCGKLAGSTKRAGLIMAQAAPLMIVLFLLFPRMEGGLIGFRQTGQAVTGFSDALAPGSVTSIAQNDDPVFRAEFKGPLPERKNQYWRGLVFTDFDGKTWRRNKRPPELATPAEGSGAVSYTISLEPHNSRWLFAMDLPAASPSKNEVLAADFTIRAGRPVNRKKRYNLVSYTDYRAAAGGWGVEDALRLPENTNPRTRQFGKQLAENSDNPEQTVEKALEYLKDKDFVYTLKPPEMKENPSDLFLFEYREGFCEHFASSFAVVMRAAQIPARVVGGYMGGEVNPFANYLIVRQSDAHAWVEVWLPQKGWTRVDPTLAAAPDRLNTGIESVLGGDPEARGFAGRHFQYLKSFTDKAKLGWDALSLRWEAWFYAYSRSHQEAILEKLGIRWHSWKGPAAALGLGFGIAGTIIALYIVFQSKTPAFRGKDPVKRHYEKFCRKLEKSGISRPPGMGPGDFAKTAAESLPHKKEKIYEITDLYIRLRYCGPGQAEPGAAKRLGSLVRGFDPGR